MTATAGNTKMTIRAVKAYKFILEDKHVYQLMIFNRG